MVGLGMSFQTETKSLQAERLEQCPVCHRRMIEGKYICGICEHNNSSFKNTPPLMASEPEHTPARSGAGAGCYRCGREDECHERMSRGYWLLCERFDLLDLLIIGLADLDDLKKYLSVNGKTSSRWNNKDGGIFDA